MIPTLLLALALAANPAADRIGVLRVQAGDPKQKVRLELDVATAGGPEIFASSKQSVAKLGTEVGKKSIAFVCGADQDGDGADELIVALRQQKQGGALQVRVQAVPEFNDWPAPVLATSAPQSNLPADGDGRVLAMCGINLDGEGPDDLLVLRQSLDGRQFLEIRPLPHFKKDPIGLVLASDADFGKAGADEVVAIACSDLDGDFHDEILALVRTPAGERIDAFRPPTAANSDTGAAIRSAPLPDPVDGADAVAMTTLRHALDAAPAVVVERAAAQGAHRLERYELPAGVSLAPATLLATDATLAPESPTDLVVGTFGLHRDPVPPWVLLSGTITFAYTAQVITGLQVIGGGYGTGFYIYAPITQDQPMEPFQILCDAASDGKLRLTLPSGVELTGTLTGFGVGSVLTFDAPVPPTVVVTTYPQPVGIMVAGDRLETNLPQFRIVDAGGGKRALVPLLANSWSLLVKQPSGTIDALVKDPTQLLP